MMVVGFHALVSTPGLSSSQGAHLEPRNPFGGADDLEVLFKMRHEESWRVDEEDEEDEVKVTVTDDETEIEHKDKEIEIRRKREMKLYSKSPDEPKTIEQIQKTLYIFTNSNE